MLKRIGDVLGNKWQLQPFLMAAYILLFNIEDYGFSYIKLNESILVFIAVLFFWWLAFFIFKFLFKDNFQNSYLATYVVFVSFFFKSICNTLFINRWLQQKNILLIFSIFFLIIVFISFKHKHRKRPLRKKIIFFLNVIFLLFIIQISQKIITDINVEKKSAKKENIIIPQKSNQHPDIYLLLFDGYANEKSLKKYWHYDDSAFLKQLTELGFACAHNSKSNYAFTKFSVASFLNLDYLEKQYLEDDTKTLHKIKQNLTVNLLQQSGYNIFDFSVFDIDKNTNVYKLKDDAFPSVSSFYDFIFSKTLFNYIIDRTLYQPNFFKKAILREKNIIDSIATIARNKVTKPKFIYYHSMLTHPPFYLDKNGNQDVEIEKENKKALNNWLDNKKEFMSFGSITKDSAWMENYLNALKYTNKVGIKLIKNILNNNQKPPIIIVMSDHGFRFLTNQPIINEESEKYSNFCAVYFPDKDYKSFYDSITPINAMRMVLNKAILTKFERLSDLSRLSSTQ